MGDSIQAAKAGILEIGDVFMVNKADREGAQQTIRDLRNMIALADREPDDWKPPIVATVAYKNEGVDEVVEALDKHYAWLEAGGTLRRRRLARARDEIEAIAVTALRERMGDLHGNQQLDTLAAQVLSGESDPYTAADTLVAGLTSGL
jgi:LAO/AO transport system kinase